MRTFIMTHFTGLLQGIKKSTELSEFHKHLTSFNLMNLRASSSCYFCISQGFFYILDLLFLS